MNQQKHFESFDWNQETFVSTEFFEFCEKEIVSFLFVLVDFVFVPNFEIAVEDGEDERHEEEKSHDHVDDEENAVATPGVVAWKHDVWEV